MSEDAFERFWSAYPIRKGDRAKQPARALFEKHVKAGVHPDDIIRGAEKFAVLEKDKVGTEFIMQAQRWLRNKRWLDFKIEFETPPNGHPVPTQRVWVPDWSPQWREWQKYLKQTRGKGSPCRNFGWWFPSEWPPSVTEN